MITLILAALLSLPAQAQEWNSACFAGLNDSQSAATLPNCESPALLNVESNLDATAIIKRKGYSKTADLTIATGPVTGSYSFIDSSGNNLTIVCNDRHCAKSTNGNAFVVILASAGGTGAVPTRWSFVDVGGNLYGANDRRDPVFKYTGTAMSYPAGIPHGSILELTQDRLAVGDIESQPNRVHYSSAGAYSEFTVGVNPEDSFFDDFGAAGDRIRGIKCTQGNCYVFKTASITLCAMADQYNTQCSVVSPNIGTTDPASIIVAGNLIYFRAQDKSYYEFGPQGLRQISKKIPNLVKSQSGGLGGGENSNTQTTKADWEAGDQYPDNTWNTTTENGSIFPSSSTFTASVSSINFYMTDVDTAAAQAKDFVANFDGSSLASGLVFTQRLGSVSASQNEVRFSTNGPGQIAIMSAVAEHSTGTWSFIFASTATSTNGTGVEMFFLSDSTNYLKTNGYMVAVLQGNNAGPVTSVQLYKVDSLPLFTVLVDYETPTNLFDGAYHTIRVSRAVNGFMQVLYDGKSAGTATDTSYSTSTYVLFGAVNGSGVGDAGDTYRIHADSITISAFYKNQVSIAHDTAFSTPTYGPYAVSLTSSTSAPATFYAQASADGSSWDAAVLVANSAKPQINGRRYVRSQVQIGPPSALPVQTFGAATLQWATTGQFTTQCIQPNSSISAWGSLTCAQTLAGNGSIVLYATSAVTCAALPVSTAPVNAQGAVQAGWVQQTNNGTLSIATNTAVFIGWRSLLTSATDQAQVDACVLSWNEGTPAQPAWATFDSIKNAVYWAATVDGASATNRLLKYDRNLEQWYPFDIAAQAPRFINNSLYFGSASAGTWNQYGLVDSDAGSAINAYWTTKDVGSDRPFQEKDFKTLSILNRNQGTGSMSGIWTNSIGNTGTYTISLSTGSGLSYARSNYNLPIRSPQQFMNVRIGNNSSTPFEVLGIGLTWAVLPWRVAP